MKLLLAAIILALTATTASASTLEWHSAKRLTVYDSTSSAIYGQALDKALADWGASPVIGFIEKDGSGCNATDRAIGVCEFSTPALPLYNWTMIWSRRLPWIAGAQVMLNTYTTDWTLPQQVYDRTLCHEVGHALGLGHNTRATSCMGNGYAPDAQDFADLEALY